MEYDAATLERTARTFRSDMWGTACDDAVLDLGIAEARFGPVQVTIFGALGEDPYMNAILGAAEPGAVEDGHLRKAIAWANKFDVSYSVAVARGRPGADAAERYLNHQGFEQGRGHWKHVRDLRDGSLPDLPDDPAITVWHIDDEPSAGETMAINAGSAAGLPAEATHLLYELPTHKRWHTYSAELEGQIVSYGSLMFDDGIARIAFDGTLPEARGRGCNLLLLRTRILAAIDAGCHTIFAELPVGESEGLAAAERNLVRAGFVPAYRTMNWHRPR
jgi:GNAT superfamily N-acetyltransferase